MEPSWSTEEERIRNKYRSYLPKEEKHIPYVRPETVVQKPRNFSVTHVPDRTSGIAKYKPPQLRNQWEKAHQETEAVPSNKLNAAVAAVATSAPIKYITSLFSNQKESQDNESTKPKPKPTSFKPAERSSHLPKWQPKVTEPVSKPQESKSSTVKTDQPEPNSDLKSSDVLAENTGKVHQAAAPDNAISKKEKNEPKESNESKWKLVNINPRNRLRNRSPPPLDFEGHDSLRPTVLDSGLTVETSKFKSSFMIKSPEARITHKRVSPNRSNTHRKRSDNRYGRPKSRIKIESDPSKENVWRRSENAVRPRTARIVSAAKAAELAAERAAKAEKAEKSRLSKQYHRPPAAINTSMRDKSLNNEATNFERENGLGFPCDPSDSSHLLSVAIGDKEQYSKHVLSNWRRDNPNKSNSASSHFAPVEQPTMPDEARKRESINPSAKAGKRFPTSNINSSIKDKTSTEKKNAEPEIKSVNVDRKRRGNSNIKKENQFEKSQNNPSSSEINSQQNKVENVHNNTKKKASSDSIVGNSKNSSIGDARKGRKTTKRDTRSLSRSPNRRSTSLSRKKNDSKLTKTKNERQDQSRSRTSLVEPVTIDATKSRKEEVLPVRRHGEPVPEKSFALWKISEDGIKNPVSKSDSSKQDRSRSQSLTRRKKKATRHGKGRKNATTKLATGGGEISLNGLPASNVNASNETKKDYDSTIQTLLNTEFSEFKNLLKQARVTNADTDTTNVTVKSTPQKHDTSRANVQSEAPAPFVVQSTPKIKESLETSIKSKTPPVIVIRTPKRTDSLERESETNYSSGKKSPPSPKTKPKSGILKPNSTDHTSNDCAKDGKIASTKTNFEINRSPKKNQGLEDVPKTNISSNEKSSSEGMTTEKPLATQTKTPPGVIHHDAETVSNEETADKAVNENKEEVLPVRRRGEPVPGKSFALCKISVDGIENRNPNIKRGMFRNPLKVNDLNPPRKCSCLLKPTIISNEENKIDSETPKIDERETLLIKNDIPESTAHNYPNEKENEIDSKTPKIDKIEALLIKNNIPESTAHNVPNNEKEDTKYDSENSIEHQNYILGSQSRQKNKEPPKTILTNNSQKSNFTQLATKTDPTVPVNNDKDPMEADIKSKKLGFHQRLKIPELTSNKKSNVKTDPADSHPKTQMENSSQNSKNNQKNNEKSTSSLLDFFSSWGSP